MKVNLEYDTNSKEMKMMKGDEDMMKDMDEMDVMFSPTGDKGKYMMQLRGRKYDDENQCMHVMTTYANEKGELVTVNEGKVSNIFANHQVSNELADKFKKFLGGK